MGKEIVSIWSHERERDNVKVTRTCYGKNERTRYVIYRKLARKPNALAFG